MTNQKTAISLRNDQVKLFVESNPEIKSIIWSERIQQTLKTGKNAPTSEYIYLEDLNHPKFDDINKYISATIRFYVDIALNRFT